MKAVNLIPEDSRLRGGGGARQGSAYIVIGVLGALVVGALLYVMTANGITEKKEQIAKLSSETQQAEAKAASYTAFESFAQIKQTRIASVTALAQARLDWERLMRELALVMPKNAFLTQLDAKTNAGPAPASATAAAEAPAGPTMMLSGCTESHSDVATVLVRLRKLYRSQDVALTTSDRGVAGSSSGSPAGPAASGTGCGDGAQFTVTVTFSAAPGSEIPKGEKRVPAALGGGS